VTGNLEGVPGVGEAKCDALYFPVTCRNVHDNLHPGSADVHAPSIHPRAFRVKGHAVTQAHPGMPAFVAHASFSIVIGFSAGKQAKSATGKKAETRKVTER
jgi:hypothetical protein